jgi:hypothetical protein
MNNMPLSVRALIEDFTGKLNFKVKEPNDEEVRLELMSKIGKVCEDLTCVLYDVRVYRDRLNERRKSTKKIDKALKGYKKYINSIFRGFDQ